MVEPVRLETLLDVLRDNLADLRRYGATITLAELKSSRDAQHMVLHAIFLAAQSSIDAGTHLLAARELPKADTYRDVFFRLADAGLLDADLARRMADWASARNIVAHRYPVLDLERLHRAITDELGDFDGFLEAVERQVGGG